MWSFDMNRCNQCLKITECTDRPIIHKGLKEILDVVEDNEGGSRSGTIILFCQEPALQAKEGEK